jgi:hypothetical protein
MFHGADDTSTLVLTGPPIAPICHPHFRLIFVDAAREKLKAISGLEWKLRIVAGIVECDWRNDPFLSHGRGKDALEAGQYLRTAAHSKGTVDCALQAWELQVPMRNAVSGDFSVKVRWMPFRPFAQDIDDEWPRKVLSPQGFFTQGIYWDEAHIFGDEAFEAIQDDLDPEFFVVMRAEPIH